MTLERAAAPLEQPAATASATDEDSLYRAFNRSVVISGLRCVLTYLILPYVTPLIGARAGLGSGLGLALGAVAIIANVFTIRRFWRARHRWRWLVTAVSSAVIVLLVVMAVRDVLALAS